MSRHIPVFISRDMYLSKSNAHWLIHQRVIIIQMNVSLSILPLAFPLSTILLDVSRELGFLWTEWPLLPESPGLMSPWATWSNKNRLVQLSELCHLKIRCPKGWILDEISTANCYNDRGNPNAICHLAEVRCLTCLHSSHEQISEWCLGSSGEGLSFHNKGQSVLGCLLCTMS